MKFYVFAFNLNSGVTDRVFLEIFKPHVLIFIYFVLTHTFLSKLPKIKLLQEKNLYFIDIDSNYKVYIIKYANKLKNIS